MIVRFDRRAVNRIVRDIPAEEADQHRIGDEDDEDGVASASPPNSDQPAAAAPEDDEVSDTVDAPEPAR